MGTIHATWLNKIPGIKVRGIMDLDIERARILKDKVSAEYATTDVEDIMKDEEIGAVLICTHHDSHAFLAIRSAQARKRIFMEKPLAMTENDCYEIKRALEKNKTDLFMGFVRRFSSCGIRAKELIKYPKVIFGQIMEPTWAYGQWAQDPHKGGGNVMSQGCHIFDMVCWYAESEPVEIFAYGGELTHQGTGLIDNLICNIRFANGVLGNVIIGDAGKIGKVQKFFLEILGGEKTACIDGFQDLYLWGIDAEEIHLAQPDRGDKYQMEVLADCLIRNKEFPCGIREGIAGTVIVLKAFESIKIGQPVKLDFEKTA
jgi:predicted dehydrogenase